MWRLGDKRVALKVAADGRDGVIALASWEWDQTGSGIGKQQRWREGADFLYGSPDKDDAD